MGGYSSLLKPLLFITCVVHCSADTHTLQYLYTFNGHSTAVGLVDGEQFVSYDRNIDKMIPKTEWVKNIEVNDTDYWDRETQRMTHQQKWFQSFVHQTKNHTEGDHTLQKMFGCECDDDNTTRGYNQYGYDGENFISLNLTTGTWTADNDKAERFIKDWERKGIKAKDCKAYLEIDCIDQLKKFVSYGNETLQRKVVPKVSVFHKHSSPSPEVVCHATGFFPKALNITWQKDGEDVHEDVELRETLPNQDGSFQKRSILKVPAKELQKHTYTCVVQHSTGEIRKDVPKGGGSIAIIIAVIAALVIVVAGIVVWRKKNSGETRKEADGKFLENGSCTISNSHKLVPQTSTDSSEGDSPNSTTLKL